MSSELIKNSHADPDEWDKHPYLHHYTTAEGLLGIWQSQSLWATHYKSLNDTSELRRLEQTLVEILQPQAIKIIERLARENENLYEVIREFGSIEEFSKDEIFKLVHSFHDVTIDDTNREPFFAPYIISFCSHGSDQQYEQNHGLLSQWRGYGKDGGVALVFDTKKLVDLLEREGNSFWYSTCMLADVVYEGDHAAVNSEFRDLIGLFKENMRRAFTGQNWSAADMASPFITSISRYKHYGFNEEREVRIVASPWPEHHFAIEKISNPNFDESSRRRKPIRTRAGPYIAIPYIVLFEDQHAPLPIERIIIGPHRNKEERADHIARMVRGSDVEVVCSETPYIGS